MTGVTPFWEWARQIARISNEYVVEGLAEFFGTFIVGLFAVGAGAQAFLTGDPYQPLWGGCLGLMFAITIFGGVSGAHVNPAVTLALAIAGKVSWIKLPIFWFAQFFGAYLGAGLAVAIYVAAIENDTKCPGSFKDCSLAAGIFSPIAPVYREKTGIAFFDQVVGTCILVMVIFSALDKRNMKIPTYMYGLLFSLTVLGINYAFGYHAGGVLNPARDIGPRLMAISVGFGTTGIFHSPANVHYWVAPFFGPLVGGALGSVLYILLVGAHLTHEDVAEAWPPAVPAGQYAFNGQANAARPDEVRKIPPARLGPASAQPQQNGAYRQNGANNNQYY